MNEPNTPDPEFVDHLEWQLKSAARRQESLNGTAGAGRPFHLRLGTTLALIVVSMFIGGAGTHAVTHAVDQRTAALYVARGEALVDIAHTYQDHFAQELARIQSLAQQGQVTEWELQQMQAQYAHAEAETQVRELELAETRITGKEPDDALYAPLVDGRDFVAERLAARRVPLQRQLDVATAQADRRQTLADNGMVSADELRAVQTEVSAVEGELHALEKRMALRASFVAGDLTAAQVELQSMRDAAAKNRERALLHLDNLSQHHERLSKLAEQGAVNDSELRAVEIELKTVETEIQLADLELQILEQKLGN